MTEIVQTEYWTEPDVLDSIRHSLAAEALKSTSLADICHSVSPQITAELEVIGIDNVPLNDPLVVIKDHPCHCDFLLLGSILTERPDIRFLAKDSPLTRALPSDSTVLLRKSQGHANHDDIKAMQQYLRDGGSLLATPWGAMNHQARESTSAERAASNVIRYAGFAKATVLPIEFEVEWTQRKQLPVAKARVVIQEPIIPLNGELDTERLRATTVAMYGRATSQNI